MALPRRRTSEDEVRHSEQLAADHCPAKRLANDAETESHNQKEEKRECVTTGVENRDYFW